MIITLYNGTPDIFISNAKYESSIDIEYLEENTALLRLTEKLSTGLNVKKTIHLLLQNIFAKFFIKRNSIVNATLHDI